MELARLVLPCMRQQRSGRIINVSSVGGMMAMPTMAVYSASKFALEGATESLYYEVRPWNIKVSLIEPSFIHSSSFQKVHYPSRGAHAERDPEDPYYMHYHHMTPFIERMMNWTIATPERVASRILTTVTSKNPPLRVRAAPDAYLFDMLRRALPRRLYHLDPVPQPARSRRMGETMIPASVSREDLTEFLFRILFCIIFIGLGAEHLFEDELIRLLMPAWVPLPRLASIVCGLWLVFWGSFILLGWHLKWSAIALGCFVVVTALVHAPVLFAHPPGLPETCTWMWDILQRSNFVKNLCLLGVCFHLLYHEPGKLSLAAHLKPGHPE